MTNLVFFLEGRSEKELLQVLMPRILGNHGHVKFNYITFQGKKDLEKKFMCRLRGWLNPDSAFVILIDQDQDDCRELKSKLHDKCAEIDKSPVLIRVACCELESWYFGDLEAVEKALELKNLTAYRNKKKYREPDSILKPSEELRKITREAYQKISGSRDIARHLSISTNTSASFHAFVKGIKKICEL
ncbi:MAG: DUF4276 family protein [Pseudomonadota bacterium]|nr:DUF4276 family protein [Pseudomonadota bacterium]